MAKKYKLTGCARFLIFLLIVGPLVYFGVSYFQGENPIEPVKELIKNTSDKIESTRNSTKVEETTPEETKVETNSSDLDEKSILEGSIKTLKDRVKDKDNEIEDLKEQIKKLEAELAREKKRDVPVNKNIGN
jgi:predicted  nucleic acid-binding Zn-ribbon protein